MEEEEQQTRANQEQEVLLVEVKLVRLERGKENVVLGISALCEASVSLRLITLTLPPVIVFMNAIIALVKATDNVTIRGASVQKDEKLEMNDSLVRAWWT